VPASPSTKRIEFLPAGDALLMISPEGFPIVVPLDIKHQFMELCSLVWTELTLPRLESRGGAYNFCWETFEKAKSGKPVQGTTPRVLRAAPLRPTL